MYRPWLLSRELLTDFRVQNVEELRICAAVRALSVLLPEAKFLYLRGLVFVLRSLRGAGERSGDHVKRASFVKSKLSLRSVDSVLDISKRASFIHPRCKRW